MSKIESRCKIRRTNTAEEAGTMDNRYRRDHEMAYYADDSVIEEQLAAKKAVREYNTVMPFDPEKGLECLDRAGILHGKNVYFEPTFHCEY